MKKLSVLVIILICLFAVGAAQATLFDIGSAQINGTGDDYNLIWDNSSSLMWLDYSFGPTNGSPYLRAGLNTAGINLAYSFDTNWNVTDYRTDTWSMANIPQMQFLYSDTLGNTSSLVNTGLFDNLLAEKYWEPSGYDSLRYFDMSNGTVSDSVYYLSMTNYALIAQSVSVTAVETDPGPGSGASPVPEPSTVILLGSGLIGLAWYGRKRKKCKFF